MISIGGMKDFETWPIGQAVVSATKTVHQSLVGKVDRDHPNYLYHIESEHWLALNMIDGAPPWDALVDAAVRWIDQAPRPLLIHCNYGKSRSPTIFIAYAMALGFNLKEGLAMATKVNPKVDIHPKLWQYLVFNESRLKGLLK